MTGKSVNHPVIDAAIDGREYRRLTARIAAHRHSAHRETNQPRYVERAEQK